MAAEKLESVGFWAVIWLKKGCDGRNWESGLLFIVSGRCYYGVVALPVQDNASDKTNIDATKSLILETLACATSPTRP